MRRDTDDAVHCPTGPRLPLRSSVAGADGWLLYDFQGVNPVLGQVLGITGMGSRRLFVLPAACR